MLWKTGARNGNESRHFQLTGIQALVRREDSWSPQGRPWDRLAKGVVLCRSNFRFSIEREKEH